MKKTFYISALFVLISFTTQAQWTTDCGQGDGMVVSFINFENNLYATGFFTNICGADAKYIAKWDGTQWSAVDTGLREAGHRVEVLNNELYVAGYRQTVDSNWVMKWDGAHFQKIGAGVYLPNAVVNTSFTANLYDVAMYNNTLIASGEFDSVGNKQIHCIMQWNGTEWDSLGGGLTGSLIVDGTRYPHQLMVYNNNLYVVGSFVYAGGVTANGIAMWDGTQWHAMGAGFNKEVYGITVYNNEIYVGGEFTMSGANTLERIAKWDGTNWVSPGFGVTYTNLQEHGYVHTLMQVGTRLVMEGGFDKLTVNGVNHSCRSVIAFDGTNVDTMSNGIANGEFEGLADRNGNVLVGGALFGFNAPDTTHVAEYHFANEGIAIQKGTDIQVYPNPANNMITISGAATGSTMKIYNMPGQEVYSTVISNKQTQVDIHTLVPGSYIVQLQDAGNNMVYRRVVKE